MDPKRIEELLLTGDVNSISKYYHIMDEIISIRGSTAAILLRSIGGETIYIDLRSMMPKHEVKTAELEYTAGEAVEAQFLHRLYARDYHELLMESNSEYGGPQTSGPDARKESRQKVPETIASLRRLAKSTRLARLDLLMRGLGFDTLVADMEWCRSKGHSVDWLVDMTARAGDLHPQTAFQIEELCFLAQGSPTLRYIISSITRLGVAEWNKEDLAKRNELRVPSDDKSLLCYTSFRLRFHPTHSLDLHFLVSPASS